MLRESRVHLLPERRPSVSQAFLSSKRLFQQRKERKRKEKRVSSGTRARMLTARVSLTSRIPAPLRRQDGFTEAVLSHRYWRQEKREGEARAVLVSKQSREGILLISFPSLLCRQVTCASKQPRACDRTPFLRRFSCLLVIFSTLIFFHSLHCTRLYVRTCFLRVAGCSTPASVTGRRLV